MISRYYTNKGCLTIETIIQKIESYLSKDDIDEIRAAYSFVQKIDTKDAFGNNIQLFPIEHTLYTLNILTDIHVDKTVICAVLLKNILPYPSIYLTDIEKNFGKEVTDILEDYKELAAIHYKENMSEKQIEALRKMFLYVARDIRVIIIRLVTRLEKLKNLEKKDPSEKIRIAKETLKIFCPLANLLGLWFLRSQLEDLCFKTLHPKKYEEYSDVYQKHEDTYKQVLKQVTERINIAFEKNEIPFKIDSRMKHLYSIYQKIENKQKSFHEIFDFIAFRIITDSISNCYKIIEIIHNIWTQKQGRFKDYIDLPKANGYQSLHTNVYGPNNKLIEIQVRTQDMEEAAEFGVAAHWYYKNPGQKKRNKWIDSLLDIRKKSGNNIQKIELENFDNIIFAFTPNNDVIDLPKGATCIDFAYAIHEELGHQADSAIVNNKKRLLSYTLENNDIVEIILKNEKKPEFEWIAFAKTEHTIKGIREWIKKANESTKIEFGEYIFYSSLPLKYEKQISKKVLEKVSSQLQIDSVKDIFIKISETEDYIKEVIKCLDNTLLPYDPFWRFIISKVKILTKQNQNSFISFDIKHKNMTEVLSKISQKLAKLKSHIMEIKTLQYTENFVINRLIIKIPQKKQRKIFLSAIKEIPEIIHIKPTKLGGKILYILQKTLFLRK